VSRSLSPIAASYSQPGDLPETRKTYRAVFSEPKVVIPGHSPVRPADSGDAVEGKPSGEGLVGAVPAEVALEASGRQKKRAEDGVELADGSTTEGSRKKRKGKK
jgi:hypothetical protein